MTPDEYAAKHAVVDQAAIFRGLLGIWKAGHALVFGESHFDLSPSKGSFLGQLLLERCEASMPPGFYAFETAFDVTSADLARFRETGKFGREIGSTNEAVVGAAHQCRKGRPVVLPFGSPIAPGKTRDEYLASALAEVFRLQRASTIYRSMDPSVKDPVPVMDPILKDLYEGVILIGADHAFHASPWNPKGRRTTYPGHGERTTLELLADRAHPHVTLLLVSGPSSLDRSSAFLDPAIGHSLYLSVLLTDVARARKAKIAYLDLRRPESPFDKLQLAKYPTSLASDGVYSTLPVTKLFDAVLLLDAS